MPPRGTTKYTALDEAIVKAVAAGKNTFSSIRGAVNMIELDERKVDSRLQALRRQKRIIYTGQTAHAGWKVQEDVNQ